MPSTPRFSDALRKALDERAKLPADAGHAALVKQVQPVVDAPLPAVNADSIRAVERYVRHLERASYRPRSVQRYSISLRAIAKWAGARSVFDLNKADVETFLDSRKGMARGGGKALGTHARHHWISTLHCFYQWAIDEELTTNDPTMRVRRPRIRRTLPRPIRDDDLILALNEATPELRAILLLGVYAGLRAQEIAGLSRYDVLDTSDPPKVWISQGKGGHERVVPLHPETIEALVKLPMPRRGLIFRRQYGSPHTPASMSKMINAYLEYLGIESNFHVMRHWFGTHVYAQSRDIRLTQELMGHASSETTAGYVRWAVMDAAKTVQALQIDPDAPEPDVQLGPVYRP